jgi:hypothetical protein
MPVPQVHLFGGSVSLVDVESSGFGFYGTSGFGSTVPVSAFNKKTYITNGTGTNQGPECWNHERTHPNSTSLAGGTSIQMTRIPNYQATFEIRSTFDVPVSIPNAEVRVYDRTNPNNPPSGVLCYGYEVRHTDTVQNNNGSGASSWTIMQGSASKLTLISSPGLSGLRPNGSATSSTSHSHYICLSASPDSVGSKTQFGLYYSMEYL